MTTDTALPSITVGSNPLPYGVHRGLAEQRRRLDDAHVFDLAVRADERLEHDGAANASSLRLVGILAWTFFVCVAGRHPAAGAGAGTRSPQRAMAAWGKGPAPRPVTEASGDGSCQRPWARARRST